MGKHKIIVSNVMSFECLSQACYEAVREHRCWPATQWE